MKKRVYLYLLLAALVLLLTCACGKTEEPATEPVTEPTSAAPATVPPTTKAPEPETVISYDFRLEELPEIGKHQRKTADCFYDEPLREFQPSDRYGTLIPYRLNGAEQDWGEFDRYGLMTADGKIVTGGVYNRIVEYDLNGKTVYYAREKVLSRRPETIPDWETDREGAQAAYRRAEDYYDDNVRNLLISADGSKCLTVRSYPDFYTDADSGAALISLAEYGGAGEYLPMDLESFLIYDSDLSFVADPTPWLEGYDYARLIAAGKDSFTIHGERNPETEDAIESELLFFKGGELDHVLEIKDDFFYYIRGGFVVCEKRIYDKDGHTLYTIGEGRSMTAYDPRSGCLYVYLSDAGKLVKIDSGGAVAAAAATTPCDGYADFVLCDSGGRKYLVISDDDDNARNRRYFVYDENLRQVCEVADENADQVIFCGEYNDPEMCVFLVGKDGRTDVLDVTGKKVASVPFSVAHTDRNYGTGDTGLVYLCRSHDRCAVYDTSDHTVTVMPPDDDTPSYAVFFSKKLLIYREENDGENAASRFVCKEIATGKKLREGIDSFECFTVGGRNYFNYTKNGTLYVCDEDLNVIATLYDNILV